MFYIIINPASKSGRGVAIWKQLEPIMTEREIPHKVIYSTQTGHIGQIVEKLCSKLSEDPNLILNLIVLGGDGTINEALQNITDFKRVRIGYIPTGSSNDLARDLKYPKDPCALLDIILQCEVKRTMDLGVLTYKTCYDKGDLIAPVSRRFITSTGIGFDAAVCEETLRDGSKKFLNKLRLGKLTYVTVALKQIIGAKSVQCEMTLDHKTIIPFKRFLFIAAMNHRFEGGGFLFAPTAKDNDGILNLCTIGDMPKYKMLMALPLAFKGKHFLFKNIDAFEASHIKLTTSEPLWVHTDGEVFFQSNHIEVTCIPNTVQFLA